MKSGPITAPANLEYITEGDFFTTETQRHRDYTEMGMREINEITQVIIGAAIEVHRTLGPGLLESAYLHCLCRELDLRRIAFEREKPLPLEYKGMKLEQGYRVDILVADRVVVEVKAVEVLLPVHEAQLMTYLRLGGWRVGLLINFNVPVLKDGIRRRIIG